MKTTTDRVRLAFLAAVSAAQMECSAIQRTGTSALPWGTISLASARPVRAAEYVGARETADARAAFGGDQGPRARGAVIAEEGGACILLEDRCPRVPPDSPARRVAGPGQTEACESLEARCPEVIRVALAQHSGARQVLVLQNGVLHSTATEPFSTLFGAVDTRERALLFVWLSGLEIEWLQRDGTQHGPEVRAVNGGFEVWAKRERGECGGPNAGAQWSERVLFFVTTQGTMVEREHHEFDRRTDSDACRPLGRRPEGLVAATYETGIAGWFARAAHLEAASVPAFERMAKELARFGAPSALQERALQALRDEQQHSATMESFAREHDATLLPVQVARFDDRSLEAFAIENATEGCIFEGYAAAVAHYQAQHAHEEAVRAAMQRIADEETAHCALALDVDAWVRGQLTEEARERVAGAQRKAIETLFQSVQNVQPNAAERWMGEPETAAAQKLAEAVASLVNSGFGIH